ncbi:helix-turn-helix domain-containing protein [Pseudomonas aeruginosa]|uniref:helix-turn-helix domain-containing protein n=1 Tax=Pseudomonas aeruginosa TaxID=287 RepID=UPI0005C574A5|nr:helix-turn-helix domain-containing protein [Pseudomonas aeruginosa]MDV7931359.1 helix-turn-helix domain-containing protein [Pseudomonas aeruginosa]HBO0095221.1 helix-turn-helix domain-containing protein [Pseudomonas aeruginosa]HBO0140216.1 helix-turn-helix domain-containing protein [Pseudomonas aeruginosa]HBO4155279.1 helix-turn-helix domain-containing protein [Pseudomonas aeruginosa]HCF5954785.1 helix-turn-helix domain-containing protein [Pseudomonas aeruginosa]
MTTKRVNETALRVLRVLIALKGHTLTGLSNGEVAKALGESPANITRYMQTLIEAGLVERREDGRFAHSVSMLQIAQAHADHVSRMQNRINEINRRVAAGSMI